VLEERSLVKGNEGHEGERRAEGSFLEKGHGLRGRAPGWLWKLAIYFLFLLARWDAARNEAKCDAVCAIAADALEA
jgi:hypothetical protein